MTNLSKQGGTAMTTIAFGSGPVRAPRLRLTRRGRAVFTTLAAAPLVAIAVFLGLGSGHAVAGSGAAGTASFTYVSIAPGQSLWQLAEQVAPQEDPREVVADILNLNGLRSADVQPGQELAIPPQYAG
jgi:hypothetical protein